MAVSVQVPRTEKPEGIGGALTRLLGLYQAYKSGQADDARAKHYESATAAQQSETDRIERGELTQKELLGAAEKGATFSAEPIAGALKIKPIDDPEATLYLKPPTDKAELITPYQRGMLELEKKKLSLMEKKSSEEKPGKDAEFKALPVESQEIVKDLSKKNASKISIANQLKSTLALFNDPNTSDDQKITAGRQAIKTLNSTEGADAVGTEEAKRLAGYLDFKLFNITEPGSPFGRDLPEFGVQVQNTIKSIEDGVARNKSQIDELYGRSPSFNESRPTNSGPGKTLDSQAKQDAINELIRRGFKVGEKK